MLIGNIYGNAERIRQNSTNDDVCANTNSNMDKTNDKSKMYSPKKVNISYRYIITNANLFRMGLLVKGEFGKGILDLHYQLHFFKIEKALMKRQVRKLKFVRQRFIFKALICAFN